MQNDEDNYDNGDYEEDDFDDDEEENFKVSHFIILKLFLRKQLQISRNSLTN